MFDGTLSETGSPLAGLDEDLLRLIGELTDSAYPSAEEFILIGSSLVQALGWIDRLGLHFSDLSAQLQSDQASRLASSLSQAVGRSVALTNGTRDIGALLHRLEEAFAASARPLAGLRAIFGEITVLAINARIEATQIKSGDTDFTVFTSEIGRSAQLGKDAVVAAEERLSGLSGSIGCARKALAAFTQTSAFREIDAVRRRLETALDQLLSRRRRGGDALVRMAERSRIIAEKAGLCVTELQIDDINRQRLDHVRDALDLLRGVVSGAPGAAPDWVRESDESRRRALVVAVCRLQARHLGRAAEAFAREVGSLQSHLRELAAEAEAALAAALEVFGSGDDLFIRTLQEDADQVSGLLGIYVEAEDVIRSHVVKVSAGFGDMVADMKTIRAIDVEMRIMGLNASLKCGRLGAAGRGLGVVAQELRAASRRTEETSVAVAAIIAGATETSGALTLRTDEGRSGAAALITAVADTTQALEVMGTAMDRSLADLRHAGSEVAGLLAVASQCLTGEEDAIASANRIATGLTALADRLRADPALVEAVGDDVARLLGGTYTMASERHVHGSSADARTGSAAPSPAETETTVDDCLF